MTLRLRKKSLFPALVEAESPILLEKNGALYQFSLDQDALVASLNNIFVASSTHVRSVLIASRTYYVDASLGNDANNGLNSGASAFKTLAQAAAAIAAIDTGGFDVTVSIVGAFTAGVTFTKPVGGGTIFLSASGPTTITTTSANGIVATDNARLVVFGANITIAALVDGVCLLAYNGGNIAFGGLTFAASALGHIQAGWIASPTGLLPGLGTISVTGNYNISGGAVYHWHCPSAGSVIQLPAAAPTITLTGTPAFSSFFAGVTDGLIYAAGVPTFVGSATGPRFYVHNEGKVVGFPSLTSFPGNAAGIIASGGTYSIDDNTNYSGFGGLNLGSISAIEANTNTVINLNSANAATVAPPAGKTALHVVGADSISTALVSGDTFAQSNFLVARRSDGTLASKSAVGGAAQVFANQNYAWDGSSYNVIATFDCLTSNAQTGSDHSSYWRVRVTPTGSTTLTETVRFQSSGGLSVGSGAVTLDPGNGGLNLTGNLATAAPTTKTANYSQLVTDSSLIFNGSGSITLTLLSAVTYPGRWLYLKNIAAQTVVSASSNVVPMAGGAASTAIMSATAGKWAWLQSDGTNWQIMAAN